MLILAGTFQLPAGESPDSQEGGQDLGLLAASPPHCTLLTPTQTHGWFQRASGKVCVFLPQGLRSWESGPGNARPASQMPARPSFSSVPALGETCCVCFVLLASATGAPGGHWEDSRPWGLHSSPAQGPAVRSELSGLAFHISVEGSHASPAGAGGVDETVPPADTCSSAEDKDPGAGLHGFIGTACLESLWGFQAPHLPPPGAQWALRKAGCLSMAVLLL